MGPLSGYVLYCGAAVWVRVVLWGRCLGKCCGAAVWAMSVVSVVLWGRCLGLVSVSVVLWGRCLGLVSGKCCTVGPLSGPCQW